MTTLGRKLAATATIAVLALGACSPVYRQHGYVPNEEDLAEVQIGATKDDIADIVGRPSSSGVLEGSGWYYVRSSYREAGWRAPREVNREVVAISFNSADQVSNVERFGLEQGRVVRLSRRVTDSTIADTSFLRQLFGNLGRFSADQFFED